MTKGMLAYACAVLMATTLAACGGDDEEPSAGGGTAPTAGAEQEVKVGLATIGPKNDKAFSQSHYEGVLEAEKTVPGVELTAVVENTEDPQSRIDAFTNLASNNDLVIGGSATYNQAAEAVAPQFPDTHFIVSTGATTKPLDNVTSLVPQEGLSALVAGAVMGELTETDTLGVIGGAEIPPTTHSINGVEAGAKETNPQAEVVSTIVGNFNDAAKAKSAAKAMIDQGADQIFGFLDAGIQGVYQAAEESGKDIGVYQIIKLNCEDYEGVVGSAIQNNQEMISQAIEEFAAGNLKAGTIFFGLGQEDIVGFRLCPNFQNSELEQVVEETTQKVVSGEIEAPADALTPRPDYDFEERP